MNDTKDSTIRKVVDILVDYTDYDMDDAHVRGIAELAVLFYLFMLDAKQDRLISGAIGHESDIMFELQAK